MRLLLFLLLISLNALAITAGDDCATIDHLRQHPKMGQFWKTPRNQDGMGWCYAFPAADLLSEVINAPASAAYVSYNYNQSATWDFSWIWRYTGVPQNALQVEEGGYTREAIRQTEKGGICLESALPSESQHTIHAHDALKQAMQDLIELRKMIEEKKLSRPQFVDCVDCNKKIQSNSSLQNFFPNLKAGELYDVIQANSSSSINTMIHSLSEKFCMASKKPFPGHRKVKLHRRGFNGDQKTFALIDDLLKQKKPVAFSTPLGLIDDTREGQHAMTIIARQKRGGQCKYLVRNSWGRGCSYYTIKEVYDDCVGEQGAVWVTKDRLNLFMEDVTYVD
ncbi:MAG: hypothetical protein LW878_04580 [Proteobacteria bacterium]|jgi:hypothetical protein|nr:hypothetical protein [Pseudomonadota bacterium]